MIRNWNMTSMASPMFLSSIFYCPGAATPIEKGSEVIQRGIIHITEINVVKDEQIKRPIELSHFDHISPFPTLVSHICICQDRSSVTQGRTLNYLIVTGRTYLSKRIARPLFLVLKPNSIIVRVIPTIV